MVIPPYIHAFIIGESIKEVKKIQYSKVRKPKKPAKAGFL